MIDFVLQHRQPPVALRIQSYWHESPDVRFFDDVSKAQLIAAGHQVEDIRDHEIRDEKQLDRRMWAIVMGAGQY